MPDDDAAALLASTTSIGGPTGPFALPDRAVEAMDADQRIRALALSWALATNAALVGTSGWHSRAEELVKKAQVLERYLQSGCPATG